MADLSSGKYTRVATAGVKGESMKGGGLRRSNGACSRRGVRLAGRFVCLLATLTLLSLSAQAQTDQILPPIGGSGGGSYVARCPQGWHLTGFELLTGDDVDAIRPICVVAYGPADVGPGEIFSPRVGGTGGGKVVRLVCPSDAPVVIAMYVKSEGVDTVVVNNIHLWCGTVTKTQQERGFPTTYPAAVFDGPAHPNSGQLGLPIIGPSSVLRGQGRTSCPEGLVAVGINGQSGRWLDSVGLICGPPKMSARGGGVGLGGLTAGGPLGGRSKTTVGSIGRVKVTTPPQTGAQGRSICEAARDARARKSPAAPNLEAQCRAAGGNSSTASPQIDAAYLALATRGEAIAEADEVVAEARDADGDPSYRQGFDIATALFGDPALGAQGSTAMGPGARGIRDRLSAAGQRGFNDSVNLHLGRDYRRASNTSLPANSNPPSAGVEMPNSGRRHSDGTTPARRQGGRRHSDDTQSNQILCRGSAARIRVAGSDTELQDIYIFRTIGSRLDSTGAAILTLELGANTAQVAAGPNGANLSEGSCAWMDRPVGGDRGVLIRFEAPANAQLNQARQGTPVDTSPTAAERFPDASSIPAYLRDENHYWVFTAYDTGQGYMQATAGRHWKRTPGLGDAVTQPLDTRHAKRP